MFYKRIKHLFFFYLLAVKQNTNPKSIETKIRVFFSDLSARLSTVQVLYS
jgi:hypothetical protein